MCKTVNESQGEKVYLDIINNDKNARLLNIIEI